MQLPIRCLTAECLVTSSMMAYCHFSKTYPRKGERSPWDPTQDLASALTFSRLEHQRDRQALYRLTRAFVDAFIASYAEPPPAIVLDLDHSDAPPRASRSLRSIIIAIRTIAICCSSFLKGRRMPSSQPPCVQAPVLPGPQMPCSWSGYWHTCGAPGLIPRFWSAAIVILLPPGSSM
jgi:Transposase DDE domain group 1